MVYRGIQGCGMEGIIQWVFLKLTYTNKYTSVKHCIPENDCTCLRVCMLFFHKLTHLTVDVRALNTQLSAIQNSLNMINTSVEAVKELQANISSLCPMIMNCNASAVTDAVTNLDMVKAL